MTELKMIKETGYYELLREVTPMELHLEELYKLGKSNLKNHAVVSEHMEKNKATEVFVDWHREY